MKEYYKITEVARLYGLCTDTLRYYEEQGLLHPHRSEAGYRLYSIDDICNLNVIRALRELDMPVEHMRRYFGERTVASTLDMLDEQDAAIRARIAALRDARAAVDARRARLERYDGQEPGLLRLLELPERPCLQLQEDVILEREIDFALKNLPTATRRSFVRWVPSAWARCWTNRSAPGGSTTIFAACSTWAAAGGKRTARCPRALTPAFFTAVRTASLRTYAPRCGPVWPHRACGRTGL